MGFGSLPIILLIIVVNMKEYKIIKGRIKGQPAGGTVHLDDTEAKAFGSQYVELLKSSKEVFSKEVETEEKQVEAPATKQVKSSPKKK